MVDMNPQVVMLSDTHTDMGNGTMISLVVKKVRTWAWACLLTLDPSPHSKKSRRKKNKNLNFCKGLLDVKLIIRFLLQMMASDFRLGVHDSLSQVDGLLDYY